MFKFKILYIYSGIIIFFQFTAYFEAAAYSDLDIKPKNGVLACNHAVVQ